MIVTVFRKPKIQEEYMQWVGRMRALANEMPGFISHKAFVAEDGERVAIVEFASEETQRAWLLHPEHVEAQKKGRKDFYVELCSANTRSACSDRLKHREPAMA